MDKVTIIDAKKSRWFPDLGELFNYRQLLFSLAWRDIKVKYAQTFVGVLWALINPLANMLVLVFVFNKVANIDTKVNPVVFTLSGLVVWNYFSALFSEAGNSIVGAQNMIKKIYFPRILIPLSKAVSGMVELGVTIICLFVFMIYYGVPIGSNVIYAPIFVLIAVLCGCTGGIWMSALSVRFRDFAFLIPFITRLGMFLSPVAYGVDAVPEKYQLLYYLNPLTGVIEGFRWALLDSGSLHPYSYISFGILIFLLLFGIVFFTRVERIMADIL